MNQPTNSPNPLPPKWADRFLEWFCANDLLEEVQGDIHELFMHRVRTQGLKSARRIFFWDVIRFFNWSTIRGNEPWSYQQPSTSMFKNYVKIAVRNLVHHKLYSLINMVGLALGLAGVILLALFTQDELNFDKDYTHADKIYRVIESVEDPEKGTIYSAAVPGPTGRTLVEDFPQFTSQASFVEFGQAVFTVGDSAEGNLQQFNEREYLFTDGDIFGVFGFKLLEGDPATALENPQSIVLTKETAERYFGSENPMGKRINCNRAGDLEVTGILADLPENTHLRFKILVPLNITSDEGRQFMASWEPQFMSTYLLANQSISTREFQNQLGPWEQKIREDGPVERSFSLQAIADIHLNSMNITGEIISSERSKSNPLYMWVFAAVAFLILLIGSINYINLATARSMYRGKEIGVRKVLGAHRMQLIFQFLTESVITTLFAMGLAIVLVSSLLPAFNDFTGKTLSFSLANGVIFWGIVIGTPLLIGLFSGAFPAFFLVKFEVIRVLKGHFKSGKTGVTLRQGLVVLQFAGTIVLLILTSIVLQQMNFIQSKSLGFDKEHLVVVDINSGAARRSFEAMKTAFQNHPNVLQVSSTSRVPGEWKNISEEAFFPRSGANMDSLTANYFCFDKDALSTFGMELTAGANFSGNLATDSTHVLINETTARLMGWKDPVGQQFTTESAPYPLTVIGVVKDFHFRSLHEEIGPLVMGYWANTITSIDYFTCRITGKNIPETLEHLEAVQTEFDPETPLEFHFLDQQIERFYQQEVQAKNILTYSGVMAILIACLGLFGLVAFTLVLRTSEIGIRKILGASFSHLFLLLSKEVLILVAIAAFIAFPFAWWLANGWLSNFAFSINIQPWVFLGVSGFVLLTAFLTVSYHISRVVGVEPAEILRQE